MAKYKCGVCGKMINSATDKYIEYKISRCKYIHETCKGDALLIAPPGTTSNDEKEFDNYVKQLFNLPKMSSSIKKRANQYIKEYGYTFSGMTGTLVYFYEIKGNPIEAAKNNIGIIPYVYDEARQYFSSINAAVAVNEEKAASGWEIETRVLTLTPPQPQKPYAELFDLEREAIYE